MNARNERGFSESLQWTLLIPVAMLAFLGILQAGILRHAHNVAGHAAAAAAEAEACRDPSPGAGLSAARQLAAAGPLSDVDVQVRREPTIVEVSVSGRIPVIIDLGWSRVSAQARVPRERAT